MGFKKIHIPIDCTTEEEKIQVQSIIEEMGATLHFTGNQIMLMYPLVRKNQLIFKQMFDVIVKQGIGPKSVASIAALALKLKK